VVIGVIQVEISDNPAVSIGRFHAARRLDLAAAMLSPPVLHRPLGLAGLDVAIM
jgi:hypothetical protein